MGVRAGSDRWLVYSTLLVGLCVVAVQCIGAGGWREGRGGLALGPLATGILGLGYGLLGLAVVFRSRRAIDGRVMVLFAVSVVAMTLAVVLWVF